MKPRIAQLLFAFIVLESFIYLSLGKDMISSAGVVIKDPESMVSEKQMYKLGFFSPPNTTHRYLGVFFAFSEEAVIWVANRGQPLQDSSGTLTLSPNGNLLLLNGANETLWSTNLTTTVNSTVTVQILDSGNLVLAEEGKLLWESFSQPSDVMVSGITLSQWQKQGKLYIIIPVAVVFVCLSTLMFIVWWMVVKRKGKISKNKDILEAGQMFTTDSTAIVLRDESNEVTIGELPKFTFEMLANATNRFHESNLLGKGGFGMVYKGILANGKEIAVKRLSAEYGQGMQEFMNEVIVISKLQHRNLVRLLGGCVEKEERILIYEYMANKSLDACLFVPRNATNKFLDWKSRYNIIEGIGRGILYLHKDSRLRIIHRDLKLSNVLLDHEWHPKISDFGMARIFRGNEDHGSTTRVVGTYGYMAPEYAMEGRFSEKSDVYSFGVLILEIVKGKKNTHYVNDEWSLSLIGCAWKMWSEGNGLGFVEESIASREMEEEMVRCIQIGLLCVQEIPKDRPAIEILVSMLSGEITELPLPKHPVFAAEMNNGSSPQLNEDGYSINGLTLTQLDGR